MRGAKVYEPQKVALGGSDGGQLDTMLLSLYRRQDIVTKYGKREEEMFLIDFKSPYYEQRSHSQVSSLEF